MLHKFIAHSLPYMPKSIVGRVASRYIAGPSLDDALATVSRLAARGFCATIDVLGEDITTPEGARATAEEYTRALRELGARNLPSGVSVKLTALGVRFDPGLCEQLLGELASAAREVGRFVRVDMEDSSLTDTTLAMVATLRAAGHTNVGSVLQAYLFRTVEDVEEAVRTGGDVRLCKGIYVEPPDRAFQDRRHVNESYLVCAKRLLLSGTPVGLATHDMELITALRAFAVEHGLDKQRFEFQALLGVPIERTLGSLLEEGFRVRLYVPYGPEWYAYSLRRLRENPAMAGHVLRAMVSRQR
jgi:proline dehydrogenase